MLIHCSSTVILRVFVGTGGQYTMGRSGCERDTKSDGGEGVGCDVLCEEVEM